MWTCVAASHDVAAGEVKAVDVGDVELVVWRGSDGRAVVMDARCPHQWSHLAAEGVIDGCEIVCAAHLWRFDAEGHGTKANMFGRRDPKSDIVAHPCREAGGRIEADLATPHGYGVRPA